jgi:uncharacterized protein (TIGR02001 family)
MNKTNSLLLAGVLSATLMTSINVNAADMAAAPAAEPASPHTLTTNFGLYTDYIFRGISYARERGSVQGSMDYSHANGFYAGVWGSNVDSNAAAIAGNTLEIDLYGGYVHTFSPDLSLNLGALYYYYPTNKKITAYSANSVDLTAALTYKYFTAKYSYMPSKYFGVVDSNGSGYVELNAAYPVAQVEGLNLTAHVGRQYVSGTGALGDGISNSAFNYTDWQIGVNKDFSIASSTGWNAGLSYIDTNADPLVWTYSDADGGYKTGDSKVLAFIKRTF